MQLGEGQRQAALQEMRGRFREHNYQGVLAAFESLGDLDAVRSGIRIEALALAARAHIGLSANKRARRLLEPVRDAPLKTDRQYGYLAAACLELGEYRWAATLLSRAADAGRATASKASGEAAPKGGATRP